MEKETLLWFRIFSRISKCHVRIMGKPLSCSWGFINEWRAQNSIPVPLKLDEHRHHLVILINCSFNLVVLGWGQHTTLEKPSRDAHPAGSAQFLEKAGSRQIFYKETCTHAAWLALPSFQEIKWHWDNNTQTTCFANGNEENEPI